MDKNDIHLFARFFIPITMIIYLLKYPYYLGLETFGHYVGVFNIGDVFFEYDHLYFQIAYFLLGGLYFIKPKFFLPVCLFLCFYVQSEIYNQVQYHDQQATFFVLSSLTLFYLRPKLFEKINLRELALLFLSLQFFGAAVSKLSDSGLAWLDGHTLQFILVEYHILFESSIALTIAKNLNLCKLLSVSAVLFQLTIPLCLFFKGLQKIYVFLTVSFIMMVYLMMRIELLLMLPTLLVFLPWSFIREKLSHMGASSRLVELEA